MTDIEQKNIFAKNLNDLLSKYGKSQREVADAIQVSPQTFNTWCQAIALPRMGKVQRLADYFHVPKSALIDPEPSSSSLSFLSSDQELLIADYDRLNSVGKEKAREYLSDLAGNPKYTKDTESHKLRTS